MWNGDSHTDTEVRALADRVNRGIVTILDEAEQPLHAEVVAERLVDQEVTVVSTAEYERRIEETLLSLHHERLPKLADAGLIEYDRDTNVARSREPVAAEITWPEAGSVTELIAALGTDTEADEAEIGVIEGREAAIEYGRQLADEADDELFCMYVSTDLLGEECVRRARSAIDRGVELYLGSQNPDVRELTGEHLPEATVWEPQLDWLNVPTYPRVGRLVLSDRRKVMVAILDEPAADGTDPEETALIGEGEDNPLVVLVRELLGPRLDHLDYQSEGFRSELVS